MNLKNDLRFLSKNISAVWRNRPSAATQKMKFRALEQLALERGTALAEQRRAQNAYYPGAETGRYRSDWLTSICTSTSLLRTSYKTLAARSEYAVRTDPYARRAMDILKTFVIGSGIRPFPSVKYVGSNEMVDGINSQLSKDWERFNDQAIRIGSQQVTVYEAQAIEFITMVTLGSFLRQVIKARPGSHLPFSVNVLKPYRLDFSHDDYFDNNMYQKILSSGESITVLGQKLNPYAEPTGFWIEGEDKPRSADNMSIHYRCMEAEQYLGIPWFTPALGNIWDVQQLSEDKLIQSRMLTRMGVWAKKADKDGFAGILETDAYETESMPFDKAQMMFTDEKPEPVQFDDKISESYGPLVRIALHAVAIGAGFSYQLLSSDLEGANFAGGRLNLITDSKYFRSVYKFFYKCSCQTLWNRFVEWEFLTGKIPGATYSQYLADPWYYSQCFWLPEGQEWVDPLKDAQAQKLLYMTGQTTLQEMCAFSGKNYKSVLAQRAKEKKELIAAGLEELLPTFSDSKSEAEIAQILANENNTADAGGQTGGN